MKKETQDTIISLIEEEFDLDIPDEDAEKVETVRDVVEYVSKSTGETE